MNQQISLNKYEERVAKFARVRALILRIVNAQQGLTIEEISKQFLLEYGFLPRIGNRIRELRTLGYIRTDVGADKRLHVYPKEIME